MSRFLAALSYLPFFFIVVLFLPKDRFVIFHIRQGFILSTLWLVWLFVWRFLPLVGWMILAPIGLLLLILMTLFGMFQALRGSFKALPFVGAWADKLRL